MPSVYGYVLHGIKLSEEDIRKIAERVYPHQENYDLLHKAIENFEGLSEVHSPLNGDYYVGYELSCHSWNNSGDSPIKPVPKSFDSFYAFLKAYGLEARPPRTLLTVTFDS